MKRLLVLASFLVASVPAALAGPLDPPAGAVAATGATHIYSLPITITTPGVYKFGRDLASPVNSAIVVNADDVTIDLDGHVLTGFSTANSAAAISGTGTRVTIKNGTIRQTGGVVNLSGSVRLVNLYLNNNGNSSNSANTAITVGDNSSMTDCTLIGNGAGRIALFGAGAVIARCTNQGSGDGLGGFFVGNQSSVTDCVIYNASSFGGSSPQISTGTGCTVSRCTIKPIFGGAAPSRGIIVGSGSSVSDCTVNCSPADMRSGISAGTDCKVTDCTITGAGNNTFSATGISAGDGTFVKDCRVNIGGTGSVGIAAGSGEVRGCVVTAIGTGILVSGIGATIDGNTVNGAATGYSVTGTSNLIVRNNARGNTADYSIGAGNAFGPIINATAGGDLSLIPASSHPQANFRY